MKKSIFLWILVIVLLGIGVLKKEEIQLPKPSLKSVVEYVMADSKGKYGIVIKNFKTGESYQSNEHQIFEAGSLYKLWVMGTALQKIKEGDLREDKILSEDIEVLNEKFGIEPEEAELQTGSISLSVSQASNQMITISHNYAALLLIEEIKLSSIEAFLKENGFVESLVDTDGGSPTTTPFDIALFYEKLYKRQLVGLKFADKMIELLQNQKLNDGLPKYLPDEIKIAHKTGDIGWFKHDAGIVYSIYSDYLIVVLSESDYPPGAQEKIALLSKAVYDYFELRSKI
ncbi:MAG: class A beta-lactamase-related serine hydrolase [Candidatus Daviesbacteria bacterium]|nr:class A beta-lactamase-related serine hydrolase [Candidatus Daviesbacteria bacterium]